MSWDATFRRAVCGAIVLLGLTTTVGAAPREAQAQLPPATFAWSLEKRFGPDRNLDLLANDPHNTFASANPATHRVTLDACSLANVLTLTYRWTIDGVTTERITPFCTLTRSLTRGNHTVTLRLTDGRAVTRTVRVRDIVIVSMGDSAASGEGSPDVAASIVGGPRWQDRRCHRSSRAASALTAKAIEDADPRSSVTFVHVACSGASILEQDADDPKAQGGILAPYAGIEPPLGAAPLPAQVDQVRAILGNRQIDVLLLQLGANDLHFADVILKCMAQARCDVAANPAVLDPSLGTIVTAGVGACSALPFAVAECIAFMSALGDGVAGESAASFFDARILPMRVAFDALNVRLVLPRSAGGLGVAGSRVFLNQYLDPTRGGDGLPCDPAANTALDPFRTLPGFVLAETTFTALTVVPTLNAELASVAARHSWRHVTGITDDFRTRGYCSTNRLVNRLDDSFRTQRNANATVHPNAAGYARISGRMTPAVRTFLGV